VTGRSALVVGPTGAIGTALVAAMARHGGWTVYGMSRSAPPGQEEFVHLAADLLDADSVRRAIARASPITHVFYAARAAHGEGGIEDVDSNVRMLMHIVNAVHEHSAELAHIHLIEGTKWYGVHLGAHRTPTREDDPRHLPPNFYYDQEDALSALQRGTRWTWSSCRPNVVCDFAPTRARNLTTIIGAYAAICRELSVPLDFPGTRQGYETLTEVTDGNHLADAILWLATQPGGENRAFNITNGDAFRWRYMWPRIAEMLGVTCGEPRDIRLASWMADKGPIWERIVARYRLAPRSLESIALWPFGDFVFRQDWDLLSSLTRLRQTGFAGSVDSVEMFDQQFEAYGKAGILPGRQ
jgi:nucleoside-diphosphate-sugar epimerase